MEQLLQHCFIDSEEGTCIEYCKYSSMGAPRVADASCQCIRAAKTRCRALEHFGGLMHALVLSLSSGWRSLTVQAKPAAHPPAEARQCIYSKLNNPAFAVIYRTLTFYRWFFVIAFYCETVQNGVHSPVRVYIASCLLRSHFLQQQNTLCCSVCSFLPSLLLVLSTIAPILCLVSHECFQPPRVVFFVCLSPETLGIYSVAIERRGFKCFVRVSQVKSISGPIRKWEQDCHNHHSFECLLCEHLSRDDKHINMPENLLKSIKN